MAKRRKLVLTPEQQELIERNRQKALERYKMKHGVAPTGSLRDASLGKQKVPALPNNANDPNGTNITNCETTNGMTRPSTYIKPTVHKKDYIEYDFSTMEDTYGGFITGKNIGKNGGSVGMSLNEWKNQQLEKKSMTLNDDNDGDDLPPLEIHNAPQCYECKSIELDKKMFEVFGCRVCKACKEKYPEKYSLLTKTECKEDYFLTEPELADLALFKRIVKENPHSGTFSRMQLFLRYQIEEYAFKKWGSEENLDNEWLRREEMRKNRREKKFNNKLKEMRKKLRAEELTKNLRAVRDKKHVHNWSLPVKIKNNDSESNNLYVKRCLDCGMQVEEFIL